MSRLKGREAEALGEAIRCLSEAWGKTAAEVEARLDYVVTETLTAADIEKKNYTYCSYFDPAAYLTLKFLVPSANKAAAWGMACNYVRDRGVKRFNKKHLYLYPRNYVNKARKLFEEGSFYRAEH